MAPAATSSFTAKSAVGKGFFKLSNLSASSCPTQSGRTLVREVDDFGAPFQLQVMLRHRPCNPVVARPAHWEFAPDAQKAEALVAERQEMPRHLRHARFTVEVHRI